MKSFRISICICILVLAILVLPVSAQINKVEFDASPVQGYTPLTVNFIDKSDITDPKDIKYNWDFGDGTKDVGMEIRHIYDKAGRYSVIHEVCDEKECQRITKDDLITIEEAPFRVDFTTDTTSGPYPLLVYFTDASEPSQGDVISYIWDFGDGATETGFETKHEYQKSQTYTVSLTVCTGGGCVTNTKQDLITVTEPQIGVVDFGATPLTGSYPLVVTFIDKSTIDNRWGAKYIWDFGDGVDGDGEFVTHTYKGAGSYNITHTVCNAVDCYQAIKSDFIVVTVPTNPIIILIEFLKGLIGEEYIITQPEEKITCGAIIGGDGTKHVLQEDLKDCKGHGITLGGNNIVLDCNGYSITGSGDTDTFGVFGRGLTDAVIRNCKVSNFDYALNIGGSNQVLIEKSEFYGIHYGTFLWDSSNITIEGITSGGDTSLESISIPKISVFSTTLKGPLLYSDSSTMYLNKTNVTDAAGTVLKSYEKEMVAK